MASGMDAAIDNASKAMDISGAAKDSVQGLQLGMSLAQRQQQLDQSRQEMQFRAQQLDMQKHDWLQDKLKNSLSEDDPKLRHVMLDQLDSEFPKIFDGKRIDPGTLELMKKSPSFSDKMLAASRIRQAMNANRPEMVPDYDKEVLNGMTSSDIGQKLGHLTNMYNQENQIIKALSTAKVATPQAAAIAGVSQEDLQNTMTQSNPAEVRRARLAMNLDDQAAKAGQSFDKDNKLNQYFKQRNGIDRAMHTIDSGGVITPQMKREIENEISTALSGQGVAGEGKLARIEFEDSATKAADWMQKLGNSPVDLKKVNPDLIGYLKDTLNRLHDAYSGSMEEVASNIASNYSQTDNDKVKAVVQAKIHQYAPKYYAQTYGNQQSSDNQPPQQPGGQSAQAAQIPQAEQPMMQQKMTQDNKALLKQQALSKIKQIRVSQPGMINMTEQDVRDKYKLLTGGEDLTE